MVSINSSALRRNAKTAARSVAEAALAGGLVLAAAAALWRAHDERFGLLIGGGSAWAASSLSTTALLLSKSSDNLKPFWWAFGGGMVFRLAVLVGLAAYGYRHEAVSQPALLLSYALGVLFFLLLETRHIKLK